MTGAGDLSVNSYSENDTKCSIGTAIGTTDNSPLVSVIVPVYNVRPYIEEALDSLINQTYRNLEIFAVDDGSDDGSGEICDRYAASDSRFRVIHQTHLGISAARNRALDAATGNIVAFLDADDAFYPDMLAKMVSAMADEGADIVVCSFGVYATVESMSGSDRFEMPGVYELRISGTQGKKAALRALADGDLNVAVFNKIYRRGIWEDLRFPEGHITEDMAVMFHAIDQIQKITVINEELYKYRSRPGSITKTYSEQGLKDYLLAYASFRAFIEKNVPETFSEDNLERFKRRCLKAALPKYVLLPGSGNSLERAALREEILQLGKDTDISKCDLRTRKAWRLFVHCPWILRTGYRIYHPVREFWKKRIR